MEINSKTEKSCTALALLFQQVVNDMKISTPVWEDFVAKATKLHAALRSTVTAATSFLEAFQKVADMATNARGATRDIGSALTRLCMRHRSIESKLKTVTSAVQEAMVMPLQEKMEDWKKVIVQLEKDRNRETKKCHQDVKKALAETSRLQKKLKKGKLEIQRPLELSLHDLQEKLQVLEENEKTAVRAALIEERARYCLLIQCIKPFMDGEISLLGDVTHLQEIMDSLTRQAVDPTVLPEASEQIIVDISETSTSWTTQIPSHHQSPAHSVSSSKSSLSSLSSSSNSSSLSPSHKYQPRTNSESFSESMTDGTTEAIPGYGSTTSSIFSHWPGSPPPRYSRQRDLCDDRPHTISSAYERSHARSALFSHTFQPPSSQVNSVPTTPNIHIMGIRSARTRPHSLVRNVELSELLDGSGALLRRRDETSLTTSMDSSMLNQPYASVSGAGDLMQSGKNIPCLAPVREGQVIMRRKQQDTTGGSCGNSAAQMSGLMNEKAPLPRQNRIEDEKIGLDGIQALEQHSTNYRSIHHSLSCSIIVNERHPVVDVQPFNNVNGNIYEPIYSEIPRRSSMYMPERMMSAARHVSLVEEPTMAGENQSGQVPLLLDQQRTGSRIHSRSISEINPCSGQTHQLHGVQNDLIQDSKDYILPPSPFRSPDSFEFHTDQSLENRTGPGGMKIEDGNEHMHVQMWTSCQEKLLSASEKEFFDERLRNPWQGMSSLMPIPSPDDTTPTNENQPDVFATNQKSGFIGDNCPAAAQIVSSMTHLETSSTRESSL